MPLFIAHPRVLSPLLKVVFWATSPDAQVNLCEEANAAIEKHLDSIPLNAESDATTIIVGPLPENDWLSDVVPLAWLAALLVSISDYSGVFRFVLFSPNPEKWQQRMRDLRGAREDLPASLTKACDIARDWLDGRHPHVGLGFLGSARPGESLMQAIPAAFHLHIVESQEPNPTGISGVVGVLPVHP